jgi:hypothetical protein
MATVPQAEELNHVRLDCLRTDLVAGLTFSRVAMQTNDRNMRDRNRKYARKAYNMLLDKMGEVSLAPEDVKSIAPLVQRLKSELESMGELF